MPILLASIHGDDDADFLFEVCQNSSCRLCLWCRIVDKIKAGVAKALKIYCSSSDSNLCTVHSPFGNAA